MSNSDVSKNTHYSKKKAINYVYTFLPKTKNVHPTWQHWAGSFEFLQSQIFKNARRSLILRSFLQCFFIITSNKLVFAYFAYFATSKP